MAITVHCPDCDTSFKVADGAAGKKGTCPNCGSLLVVGHGRLDIDADANVSDKSEWHDGSVFPVFSGHSGAVNAAVISYGGTLALTAGEDSSLRLWDVSTGLQSVEFRGHKGPVNDARLDLDGNFAVSGGDDATVRIWNLSNGKCIRVLEGHKAPVLSVTFHPGGPYAISGSADKTAIVWDIKKGEALRVLKKHKGAVTSVDSEPSGAHFLTASTDKAIFLWRFAKGKVAKKLKGHGGQVTSARYSPDAFFVASGSADRTAVLWDVERKRPVRIFKGHQAIINSVAVSGDNATFVSGSADWTLRVWDVDARKVRYEIDADQQPVTAVAVDHEGVFVLSGSGGGTVRLYDARSGAMVRVFAGEEHSMPVRCPGCGKVFQLAASFVGRRGGCPYCKAVFTAAVYSPGESAKAVKSALEMMHEGRLEGAAKELEKAIRLQGDNYRALLGSITCRFRMGSELSDEMDHQRGVNVLAEAAALYEKGEPWPLEFVAQAKDEAYKALFLAAKISRFRLNDDARALELARAARRFASTIEVQDLMSNIAAGGGSHGQGLDEKGLSR